jgi:hypothetical protein
MPKDTPYRAPIAPEVCVPVPPLVVVWRDAERSPWKAFLLGYYGLLGAALGLAALASVSPHAAGVCAAGGRRVLGVAASKGPSCQASPST